MICARGALFAAGPMVSRVRPVGIIGAVGSRCLRSRGYPKKAGVRPVAERELRTRRRLFWRKHLSRWRPRAAAAGITSGVRYPLNGHGAGGRPSGASGARAFTACRPPRGSPGYAHDQNIAWHRPLDLGSLASLRARARSPGGGPTPFAELLGSCHGPWPDADHSSARATLARLKGQRHRRPPRELPSPIGALQGVPLFPRSSPSFALRPKSRTANHQ